MMKVKPLERQSLADITIQATGSIENIFAVSRLNDISISGELTGAMLEMPEATHREIVVRYAAKNVRPATEITQEEMENAPYGGIGFMGIEIDFIVS